MSVTPFDSLTVTFEVSWSTGWAAAPSYTDESAYVRGFTVTRGRSSEFDQFPAGTLSIELDNSTRRFDPLYTSSPLSPNVVPRKKCRLSVTYSAVTYRLFTGYLDAIPQQGEMSNVFGTSTFTASDGMKMLARVKVPTGGATVGDGETIAARVGRLLDYAAFPASARDIDTNTPTVVQMVEDGSTVLENLYTATQGDLGVFFMAGDGDATYRGHLWLLGNNTTATATIGESIASSEIPYQDVVFTYDDTLIYNRVLVSLQTGNATNGYTDQTVDLEDATSITAYGESVKDLGSVAVNNLNVASNTAEFVRAHYKDPKLRCTQVTFTRPPTAALAATQYPMMLGAELATTRWTFKRRPQNVGTAISQDVIVEGIRHQMTVDTFTSTFNLSQAPTSSGGGTYWLMGSGKWTTGTPPATWA